jgi:hypothetical protein
MYTCESSKRKKVEKASICIRQTNIHTKRERERQTNRQKNAGRHKQKTKKN